MPLGEPGKGRPKNQARIRCEFSENTLTLVGGQRGQDLTLFVLGQHLQFLYRLVWGEIGHHCF